MKRHRNDPFPVQGRYLGGLETVAHDPLEAALARREAELEEVREAIDSGQATSDEAQDLRGIPVIARGVGGTSPGSNPLAAAIANDHRLRRAS